MKNFLLDVVSNKSTGYEILVCKIVDYSYAFRQSLEPYRNLAICNQQLPHCFHFQMAEHNNIQLGFCRMKYKFVSTFPYQPQQPEPSAVTCKELSNIVVPYLASVGGVQKFAKAFKYAANIFENEPDEQKQCEKLQNLLVADGYPKDVIQLLNMFEADSMKRFMQRYDDVEQSQHDNTTMKIKPNLQPENSKFDQLDFNILGTTYTNSKTSGFIRYLKKLPKVKNESTGNEEIIDLGILISSVNLLTTSIFLKL